MEGITNCAVFPAHRTSCSIRPVVLPFNFLSQTLSDVAANSQFNVHCLCIYSRQKSSVGIIFLWSLYSKALFTMLLLYMPLRLRPLPYILTYVYVLSFYTKKSILILSGSGACTGLVGGVPDLKVWGVCVEQLPPPSVWCRNLIDGVSMRMYQEEETRCWCTSLHIRAYFMYNQTE